MRMRANKHRVPQHGIFHCRLGLGSARLWVGAHEGRAARVAVLHRRFSCSHVVGGALVRRRPGAPLARGRHPTHDKGSTAHARGEYGRRRTGHHAGIPSPRCVGRRLALAHGTERQVAPRVGLALPPPAHPPGSYAPAECLAPCDSTQHARKERPV